MHLIGICIMTPAGPKSSIRFCQLFGNTWMAWGWCDSRWRHLPYKESSSAFSSTIQNKISHAIQLEIHFLSLPPPQSEIEHDESWYQKKKNVYCKTRKRKKNGANNNFIWMNAHISIFVIFFCPHTHCKERVIAFFFRCI